MLTGLKRMVRMVFRRPSTWLGGVWQHRVQWYKGVGDVTNSSTVATTVMWCARNFPEAPPAMWTRGEQVYDHDMLRLLQNPNPYFTGVLFWMATVTDWKTSGEAFWWKQRDGIGRPARLWWIPSWLIRPVGDEDNYITHYEYAPNSDVAPLALDPADIVPFRFGVDPDDPLRGQSPLKCVLREVFTDDEAAVFTASILSNMGVPGVVVSPEQPIDRSEAKLAKDSISEGFTGTRRGEPMVMTVPTKISQFGFSPEQLVLTSMRRVPEERVTAALGVPAIVVGLGAGLDRSTFTNMGEASEYAYSNGLIPDQRIMADVVKWHLLPDFEKDPFMWEVGFDLTKVRALKEDTYKVAQRMDLLYRGNMIMRSEGRRTLGLEVVPQRDDVFMLPPRTALTDEENVIETTDVAQPAAAAAAAHAELVDVQRQHSRGMLELAAAVAARPEPAPQPLSLFIDPPDVHVQVDPADVHVDVEAGEPPVVHNHVDAPDMGPIGAALAERRKTISVTYDEAGRPSEYTSEVS